MLGRGSRRNDENLEFSLSFKQVSTLLSKSGLEHKFLKMSVDAEDQRHQNAIHVFIVILFSRVKLV